MVVGLTGGIGSGKSTVAQFFSELGVPVYISDEQAKILMKTKTLKKQIIALLGEEAYNGEELNRKSIADKVFNNSDLLSQLNAIVHPAVKNNFIAWQKNQDYPYVIQETAILFENGSEVNFDKIILVTAPEEIRIDRITKRDTIEMSKVQERMANQWADEEKAKKSDFIINNINLTSTLQKVHEIHKKLLKISC